MSRSLTGLTIQPSTGNTLVVPGVSAQFKAIGTYTESGHASVTQDITTQVTWSTVIPAVATVSSTGLATGVAPGTTSIIASIPGGFGNLTATSNIVVNAPASSGAGGSGTATRTLTSVTVIPGNQTLNVTGQSAQLIAMGSYSASPSSANLTTQVSWVSSDNSIAQVSAGGLVTATGTGTATISALATAPDGSVVSGSAAISVTSGQTARTLTALNITPGSQTLPVNQTANLLAIGTYNTSPESADLTGSATWVSSDTSVATVNGGVVTAIGAGTATITAKGNASDGGVIVAGATVTVEAATASQGRTLTSLSIIPLTQTVNAVGETGQFLAIGTYSTAPLTIDLTDQVKWLSSDVLVGTIDSAGLATAVGYGESTITAMGTASDGSEITASATFQWPIGQNGATTLPTLAVYGAGSGSGTVTGPDAIGCSYTGPPTSPVTGPSSSPPAGCTGTFTVGTVVTLTATADPTKPSPSGSKFDGWSSNCTPVPGNPNQCTITMNNNTSVGAIFDPQ